VQFSHREKTTSLLFHKNQPEYFLQNLALHQATLLQRLKVSEPSNGKEPHLISSHSLQNTMETQEIAGFVAAYNFFSKP
jgi:hypothetical protein